MDNTPRHARTLRSNSGSNTCFPLSLTNDLVYEFAVRLDTQVKKCMADADSQNVADLVPIIVDTLTSLDQHMNDLLECQNKRDALQDKVKSQTAKIKKLRQDLEIERKAHQDTILDSDTQILELTEEKRSAKLEYENLRKKISNDKINIETVNKRIDQLSSESNEVSLENNALKESIDTLRTRLNHLQIRVKERNIRMISNPHPQQSQHRSIPQNETHDTDIGVKKVHVLGDSNVRGLGAIMSQNYANSKTRILTSCIPGGGLCQLKNSFIQDPVPGDTIILHAGTNDICHTKWEEIKKSLEEMCTGFSQCNIVVFTVPPRYDYPYLNKHINKFNTLVKYAVQNYGNVRLVITKRIITPKQMKADGIHYNQRGQQKIAKKMMDFSSRIGHQLRDSMTIISLDTTEAPHIAPHSSTETAPLQKNRTNVGEFSPLQRMQNFGNRAAGGGFDLFLSKLRDIEALDLKFNSH
ncbi:hypothetical protein M8J76_014707 [Diaphorina citri]|nr:hypothetical protein M8J76_014707 [Diaphorina citri]